MIDRDLKTPILEPDRNAEHAHAVPRGMSYRFAVMSEGYASGRRRDVGLS